jgi:putative SOS response-associated peptidase YedK
MCNEFRFRRSLDDLLLEFSQIRLPLTWEGGAPNLEPRDSIRPTDPAVVISGAVGGAKLSQLRWGFPNQKGGPIINFRSENRRFGAGRCIVPADGFYEFTGAKSPKSKWLFEASDGGLLGIAGLIRDDRFTLLTTAPGPDIQPYHDRHPGSRRLAGLARRCAAAAAHRSVAGRRSEGHPDPLKAEEGPRSSRP